MVDMYVVVINVVESLVVFPLSQSLRRIFQIPNGSFGVASYTIVLEHPLHGGEAVSMAPTCERRLRMNYGLRHTSRRSSRPRLPLVGLVWG